MSDLTLQILDGTTHLYDFNNEFAAPLDLWYETGYPGGRYLAGGCFIPRVPQDWWEINKPMRVVIRSGQQIVYEGVISDFQHRMSAVSMGVQLNFMGFWGWMMSTRTLRKRWADDRVDDQTWEWGTAATAADKCTVSRESRLRFLPKSEEWADDDYARLNYQIPTSTIKRITFDYDLTCPAGEDWTAILRDVDNSSTEWSVNQSGAGTSDGSVDLDSTNDFTATTYFRFQLQNTAGGAVTPASDGSTYLNITNLMVYSEDETATSINLDNTAADIITTFSDVINSDTSYLDASDNVRAVEPFITDGDGYEAIGDILMRMAGFGDSNDAPYAVGLLHSEKAASPDGKPVLFTEAWPVTTSYDYFISLEDDNIMGSVNITRDYASVFNEVRVAYRDDRGWQQIATSSDDAGLADSTSQTDYGVRVALLSVGNSTAANAYNYGTRFIQKYKDPQWVVNGSIGILWGIEGSSGELIPASRVEAGKRLKIDGYDTFVISRTRYDADSETVEITVGQLQDPIFNESVFAPTWNDPVPTKDGTSSGGSSGGGTRIWEHLGLSKSEYLGYKESGQWSKIKQAAQKSWRKGGGFKGWRDYYSGSAPF